MFIYGVPIIRFIGLLGQKFSKVDNTVQTQETTPLRAPKLDYLPAYTNKNKIEIKGVSEPQAKVDLVVNNQESKSTLSSDNGSFEFLNIPLKDGGNKFKLVATLNGQSSSETNATVIFDKKAPTLEVLEPADNAFYPKKTKEVKVSGKTDLESILTVNDIQAIVNIDGTFNFVLQVNSGETKIKIISKDQAGNQTVIEKTLTVDADALDTQSSPTATQSAASSSAQSR